MTYPTEPRASPSEIPESELVRSMRYNIVAGGFGTVWMAAAYGFPLPLFMQALHATGFQLGIMGAVRQFAMFAQLPSAYIVERLATRKPYWAVVAITHRALWFIPALLPFLWPRGIASWPVLLIFALGLSDVLGQCSTAPWLSWMADLLPPERAGRFWGVRQRILAAFLVLACLLYGRLLDSLNTPGHLLLGFACAFAIAAFCGVADIVVHFRVVEPLPPRHVPGRSLWTRLASPFRQPGFRRLTLAMGAWNAAMALTGYSNGTPGFFNIIYLQENFGASYLQASWLIIASAAGAMLWTPRIGHAIDRFGARLVGAWLIALGPFFTLAWFFVSPRHARLPFLGLVPQPVVLMSSLSLIIGGLYAGVFLCQLRLTQAMTVTAGRTLAMAVHWASVGCIASLGALSGGWIKDHFPPALASIVLPFGAHCSYFQVLVLLQALIAWSIALPILVSVKEESQHLTNSAAPESSLSPLSHSPVAKPPV